MRKVAILAGAGQNRPRQMRYYTQYFVPLGVPGKCIGHHLGGLWVAVAVAAADADKRKQSANAL